MTSAFRGVTPSTLPSVARRPFGQTDMQVGLLGFGGAEIGFEKCDDQTVDRLVGLAVDLGINVMDTAAMYADSEQKARKRASEQKESCSSFYKMWQTGAAPAQFFRARFPPGGQATA